jgi:CoA transferase family III
MAPRGRGAAFVAGGLGPRPCGQVDDGRRCRGPAVSIIFCHTTRCERLAGLRPRALRGHAFPSPGRPATERAMPGVLSDLRVLDLADQSGALAGRLLAGLGADVVGLEPRDGSPLRRFRRSSTASPTPSAASSSGSTPRGSGAGVRPRHARRRRAPSPSRRAPTCSSRPGRRASRPPPCARPIRGSSWGHGHSSHKGPKLTESPYPTLAPGPRALAPRPFRSHVPSGAAPSGAAHSAAPPAGHRRRAASRRRRGALRPLQRDRRAEPPRLAAGVGDRGGHSQPIADERCGFRKF